MPGRNRGLLGGAISVGGRGAAQHFFSIHIPSPAAPPAPRTPHENGCGSTCLTPHGHSRQDDGWMQLRGVGQNEHLRMVIT